MSRKNVIWADEKTLSKDISGKVYIVNGANSGVGLETTRQLVKQGGHVIMACRRPDTAEEVAKEFAGLKGSFETMRLDLANLVSVRNFSAYSEAKVAAVLYAMELAKRLEGTGVTTASVQPGWARSNFGKGGNIFMRTLMASMRPFTRAISDSNEESAQTSLHCLLSDDAPKYSGAYFSQSSVLLLAFYC